MANEFSGRKFPCETMIPMGPPYQEPRPLERTCSVVGAQPDEDFVVGDFYIRSTMVVIDSISGGMQLSRSLIRTLLFCTENFPS